MVQLDPGANGDPEALCPRGCLMGLGSSPGSGDPSLQDLLGSEMTVCTVCLREGARVHRLPNNSAFSQKTVQHGLDLGWEALHHVTLS